MHIFYHVERKIYIYIKKITFPFIFYFFVTEVFFNYALLHSLKILSLAAVFAIFVPVGLRSPRRLNR